MSIKEIKKRLELALVKNGEMQYQLYEYELQELIDDFRTSLIEDRDEFLFAVTEHTGDVAMVLIERSGATHINEVARERLMDLWKGAYLQNMKKMIPVFAKQLNQGEIPVNGVKTIRT
ncbi:MAG: hypothetical protein HQK63_11515 [Desulfamplus sp.]|nr:hypothetical protein [Desulfamplus sp.]